MFPESKSPFAAASSNGSAPSPFQPADANGSAQPNGASSNGSAATSPFAASAPASGASAPTSIPEPKKAPETPSSPFAVAADAKSAGTSPFEPALVEPTEGFAASEAASQRPASIAPAAVAAAAATPSPVAMPDARAVNGNRNDPFAVPAPSSPAATPAGRADFVLPAESGQAAAAQSSPAQPAPGQTTPAAATPAVVAAVTGETSQLVLRAIFGVTRELDRNEILQRARTLPGIRNLHMVGQNEGSAMNALRDSIQRMGFGDQASLALTTSGGVVDFIEESGTTLAVLHEGAYAAGVRETLIIVARELTRLG